MDLAKIIFEESSDKRETRKLRSLFSLTNEGYTLRDPFVIKFENGFIKEPVFYKATKVGLCYEVSMDEYREAMRSLVTG